MRTWHFLNYLHEDLTIWPAWGPAYLLYDLHEDLTIFFMTCMRTWLSSTEYDLHEDHIIFYMTYMRTWLSSTVYDQHEYQIIWPAWGQSWCQQLRMSALPAHLQGSAHLAPQPDNRSNTLDLAAYSLLKFLLTSEDTAYSYILKGWWTLLF